MVSIIAYFNQGQRLYREKLDDSVCIYTNVCDLVHNRVFKAGTFPNQKLRAAAQL